MAGKDATGRRRPRGTLALCLQELLVFAEPPGPIAGCALMVTRSDYRELQPACTW